MFQALGSALHQITRAILATLALKSIVPFSLGEAETRKAKCGGEQIEFLGSGFPSGATLGRKPFNIPSLLFGVSPGRGCPLGGA